MTSVQVLDKGYIRLVETNLIKPISGSDLTVVNAARSSFLKESPVLTEQDKRLLKFLAEHGHTSPYRHAVVTLEIKAPMMIARQWFKQRVGSVHSPDTAELLGVAVPEEYREVFFDYVSKVLGFVGQGDDQGFEKSLHARNEASRRYVTLEPEFYLPEVWRSAPENKKQGSGGPAPRQTGQTLAILLADAIEEGMEKYNLAMSLGVAPEQARLFIPSMYGLYTNWYWTASVQAVAFFLNQRLPEDAQEEIQQYAIGLFELVKPLFEYSMGHLVKS